MSEASPAWNDAIHTRAQAELSKLHPESEDELLRMVSEACKHRNPADHPRCDYLQGYDDLMKVRIEGYRAICTLQPPMFLVLLVDKRRTVYDRLDVAVKRAGGER